MYESLGHTKGEHGAAIMAIRRWAQRGDGRPEDGAEGPAHEVLKAWGVADPLPLSTWDWHNEQTRAARRGQSYEERAHQQDIQQRRKGFETEHGKRWSQMSAELRQQFEDKRQEGEADRLEQSVQAMRRREEMEAREELAGADAAEKGRPDYPACARVAGWYQKLVTTSAGGGSADDGQGAAGRT